MERTVGEYARLCRSALRKKGMPDADAKTAACAARLERMYAPERFRAHGDLSGGPACHDEIFRK